MPRLRASRLPVPAGTMPTGMPVPASSAHTSRTVPSPPQTRTRSAPDTAAALGHAGAGVLDGRVVPRRLGPAGLHGHRGDERAELADVLDLDRVEDDGEVAAPRRTPPGAAPTSPRSMRGQGVDRRRGRGRPRRRPAASRPITSVGKCRPRSTRSRQTSSHQRRRARCRGGAGSYGGRTWTSSMTSEARRTPPTDEACPDGKTAGVEQAEVVLPLRAVPSEPDLERASWPARSTTITHDGEQRRPAVRVAGAAARARRS